MKSETKDLTDAELNRMVAECEGWTLTINANWQPPDGGYVKEEIPDYCASHDAILPCVRALPDDLKEDWAYHVYILARRDHTDKDLAMMLTSARTLVLAYLKAKSKI